HLLAAQIEHEVLIDGKVAQRVARRDGRETEYHHQRERHTPRTRNHVNDFPVELIDNFACKTPFCWPSASASSRITWARPFTIIISAHISWSRWRCVVAMT